MADNRLVKLDYFYDATVSRYIMQVVRAFSGWQYVSYAKGVQTLNVVPCLPDQQDALVAAYVSGNTPNNLPTVPAISVSLTSVSPRRDDLMNPTHVSTIQVSERAIVAGKYTADEGRTYQVERMMPRPFELLFDIDVWTSNKDQKLQLIEQMMTVMYPAIEIQASENAIDWATKTTMYIEDLNYSSVSGPVGTDGARIDYFTIKARLPIWLSPPARVSQRKRIEQIVTNIYKGEINDCGTVEGQKMVQVITSPGDHSIRINNNVITLLGSHSGIQNNGGLFDWAELITGYGSGLRPGISTIHLSTTSDIEDIAFDIVGTINYSPNGINLLTFTPDPATLPATTIGPISGVVNPMNAYPGNPLPNAVIGQRYLFQHGIVGPTEAWGSLTAEANDIVEFDGTHWVVSYHPQQGDDLVADIVENSYSGRLLKWSEHGWVFAYDGTYHPGYWRLHI